MSYGIQHNQWAGQVSMPQVCRICRSGPVANVTIRRHVGIILAMRFHKVPGPLCRHCGIALFRDWTSLTLFQGWWSLLSFILFNWVTLINNLRARSALLKLPEPDPRYPRRLVLGRPVTRRWTSLVGLAPIVWVILVVVAQM